MNEYIWMGIYMNTYAIEYISTSESVFTSDRCEIVIKYEN